MCRRNGPLFEKSHECRYCIIILNMAQTEPTGVTWECGIALGVSRMARGCGKFNNDQSVASHKAVAEIAHSVFVPGIQ